MGERPRLELYAGLASLWQSRDFADLVISGNEGSRHSVNRAVVCPRSDYLYKAVKEGRWKDGNEGHLALEEEDEVVRLMLEYLYLLDYDPAVSLSESMLVPAELSHSSSDTMSIRTDACQYGQVYGTSAVSAFGGPQSSFEAPFRSRTDSSLTMHALPIAASEYASYPSAQPRRRKTTRGMVMNAPEPSPLATKEPYLVLHARMYSAANRYGIHGLKALSLDKFKIQLTRHWDSPELAQAVHVVYTSTPSSDKDMREAIADTLGWHSGLLDKPEIEVAILEINGLAYELLKRSRRAEPEYMQ